MEFSRYMFYDLLNRPGPLYLAIVDLNNALLYESNLWRANLNQTNMEGDNLTKAELIGATVADEQLAKASSLN